MKRLANTLHSLLCEREHTYDVQALFKSDIAECRYYLEEQMIEAWECGEHIEWLERAGEFMSSLQLPNLDEDEIEELVNELVRKVIPLNQFLREHSEMQQLAKQLVVFNLSPE